MSNAESWPRTIPGRPASSEHRATLRDRATRSLNRQPARALGSIWMSETPGKRECRVTADLPSRCRVAAIREAVPHRRRTCRIAKGAQQEDRERCRRENGRCTDHRLHFVKASARDLMRAVCLQGGSSRAARRWPESETPMSAAYASHEGERPIAITWRRRTRSWPTSSRSPRSLWREWWSRLFLLAEEDADGVLVDLVDEVLEVRCCFEVLVPVSATVSVGPVKGPARRGWVVSELGDVHTRPFARLPVPRRLAGAAIPADCERRQRATTRQNNFAPPYEVSRDHRPRDCRRRLLHAGRGLGAHSAASTACQIVTTVAAVAQLRRPWLAATRSLKADPSGRAEGIPVQQMPGARRRVSVANLSSALPVRRCTHGSRCSGRTRWPWTARFVSPAKLNVGLNVSGRRSIGSRICAE